MLEKFIRAKHWQLFILTTGIVIIGQAVFMSAMMSQIMHHREPDPEDFFYFIPVVVLISLIAGFVQFGWYYAVVVKMDEKIPAPLKINMRRFKVFFFIPVFYIILISITVMLFIGNITPGSPPDIHVALAVVLTLVIIPLHLFSIFCIGHTFYCVGKSIKLAETGKPVKFEDFAGEFFLSWFFLIGVWIMQPKINKLWSGEINPNPGLTFKEPDTDIL